MKVDPNHELPPLLKHQKSVDCVFGPKNEDLYYGVLKIKLILVIQGNRQNHLYETFICDTSTFLGKAHFSNFEEFLMVFNRKAQHN